MHIFNVYFCIFLYRELQKKTTAADNGKIIISGLKNVIIKRFPELLAKLNELPDVRNRQEYSMAKLLNGALFMFIFKEESRNAFNNHRRDLIFSRNYRRHLKLSLPHPDTVEDILRVLPWSRLRF